MSELMRLAGEYREKWDFRRALEKDREGLERLKYECVRRLGQTRKNIIEGALYGEVNLERCVAEYKLDKQKEVELIQRLECLAAEIPVAIEAEETAKAAFETFALGE